MKISNSKKQLAKIISENGGWREGAKFAAQDIDGEIFFYETKPTRVRDAEAWGCKGVIGGDWINCGKALPNWHQTLLSRDEYFHLYPAPDADDMPSEINNLTQVCDTDVVELKTTLEQLAAEYRNRKDYAERKQQEADAAKADVEVKLAELVAAGKAVGLAVSVDAQGPEPELVITNSAYLLEGDVIELTAGKRYNKTECTMVRIDGVGLRAKSASDTEDWWNIDGPIDSKWRFIRRPAKEANHA